MTYGEHIASATAVGASDESSLGLGQVAEPHQSSATTNVDPLVSVVISNYNYVKYVGAAIDSVLAQSYRNVECIVVDDGSTDGSRELLATYPKDKVTVILQNNAGQAAAVRAGFEASRGEIFMSLDADDWLYPNACAEVVANWKPGAAAVLFMLDLTRNGEKTGETYPNEPFLDDDHLAYALHYGYYPCSPMSGNAFSRKFVQALFAKALHLDRDGVDAYLLLAAPSFGELVTIRASLGAYRLHGKNVSMASSVKTVRNLSDHIYHAFWAQQTLARMVENSGIFTGDTKLLKGPYYLRWYLMTHGSPKVRSPLPTFPYWQVVGKCIGDFAIWPNLTLYKRATNIGFMLGYSFLPRSARALITTCVYR